MSIRVLLADDHPFYRAGVSAMVPLIDPGIVVVGEAGDGAGALESVASLRPHVVLMDLAMPGIGGIEATRRIRAAHPDVAVLVLTMLDDDSVVAAVEAGAGGYLLKDAAVEDVCRGIRSVARGELVVAPTPAARLLTRVRAGTGLEAAFPQLTARERDILALIAEGADTATISRRLHLTPKTVRNYVSTILAKTGARDRASVAATVREALGTLE